MLSTTLPFWKIIGKNGIEEGSRTSTCVETPDGGRWRPMEANGGRGKGQISAKGFDFSGSFSALVADEAICDIAMGAMQIHCATRADPFLLPSFLCKRFCGETFAPLLRHSPSPFSQDRIHGSKDLRNDPCLGSEGKASLSFFFLRRLPRPSRHLSRGKPSCRHVYKFSTNCGTVSVILL